MGRCIATWLLQCPVGNKLWHVGWVWEEILLIEFYPSYQTCCLRPLIFISHFMAHLILASRFTLIYQTLSYYAILSGHIRGQPRFSKWFIWMKHVWAIVTLREAQTLLHLVQHFWDHVNCVQLIICLGIKHLAFDPTSLRFRISLMQENLQCFPFIFIKYANFRNISPTSKFLIIFKHAICGNIVMNSADLCGSHINICWTLTQNFG